MAEDQTGRTETLAERVQRLKHERGAVVLAHYYVPVETQRLADYVGDSFYLARLAKTLEAPVIVLCGVSFMAESVKLLNPARRVLVPEPAADCPMAHMVRREDVDRMRATVPDLAVVAYVNTTSQIKRWADVCVTSSNAVKVVRELPEKNILFIPDMNLGRYVAEQVPEKHVILNQGYCPIHNKIGLAEVEALRREHPDALVLAHPECRREVLDTSDFIGSTKQIIERIAAGREREFIVLTVVGIALEIARRTQGQDKSVFFPEPAPACPDMDLITPEKLLACLEGMTGEVATPEGPQRAVEPLERMLELAGR